MRPDWKQLERLRKTGNVSRWSIGRDENCEFWEQFTPQYQYEIESRCSEWKKGDLLAYQDYLEYEEGVEQKMAVYIGPCMIIDGSKDKGHIVLLFDGTKHVLSETGIETMWRIASV